MENMDMGTEYKITVTFDGENYVIILDEYDESDFWMMPYLTAGVTYYIEVSASSTGSYVLHIE